MEELQLVEYNDIRVVTTKQLAKAYGVETKILTKNFNRNKNRYTEGKHYFKLQDEKLKDFKTRCQNDVLSKARTVYLWTERGILLHAKSINTDVAWEAYERLIDFYFQKKKEFQPTSPVFDDFVPHRVPMVKDWYERNAGRIRRICFKAGINRTELYHRILERLGERYDLNAANEIYKQETGEYPAYAIDIVRYFPELDKAADVFLDSLEKYLNKPHVIF